MKKRHTPLLISLTAGFSAVGLVGAIAWGISPLFKTQLDTTWNVKTFDIVNDANAEKEDTEYYKSSYESDEALAEDERNLCANLEAEGAVLLKNENHTLPLAKSTRFSMFSTSSVDPVYGGTGSGQVNISDAITIRKALNTHFNAKCTNTTLFNHYNDTLSKYRRVNAETTGGSIDQYLINEAPWSEVNTPAMQESWKNDYNDVALVFIARSGGEGNDLPMTQCKDGINGDYLHLSQNEMDMLAGLKAYKDNGTFKKIVVLLNGSNMVQLDFLTKDTYGIDAALWIGDPGTTGMEGVASILAGDTNPSGRLSETFLNNTKSSPAAINFGLHAYTNSSAEGMTGEYKTSWTQYNTASGTNECNENYIVYQEGIYIGYKYYETRYEDYVTSSGNAGDYHYYDDVAYPFGYGQSYTTWEYSNLEVKEHGENFDVKVTIKNNGSLAGKNSAEIYVQTPYTDYDKTNGIEKAAVQLAGFTKSGVINPGESETVNLTIKKRDIASYDANKAKTYILDAGDYYFTVGNGAHEAINNVLSAKGYTPSSTAGKMDAQGNQNNVVKFNLSQLDDETCSTSEETGYKITNQFDHADLNKYEGTKDDQSITYLTRKDWLGTMPSSYNLLKINAKMWEDGLTADAQARKAIVQKMIAEHYSDITTMEGMNENNGMSAVMMRESDIDENEEAWNNLVNQASFDEMHKLIANGFHRTNEVPSLGLPATLDENGPQGYTKSLVSGNSGMGYTSEDIMASTRNLELVANMGKDIGEDCRRAATDKDNPIKTAGLYGPACNLHRTPYCGRNFEYYSEDSLLSSKTVEPEVAAIQKTGIYVFTKHFALNDQESGRYGLSTWANEQSIRELYLRAFEGSVLGGGAGVMTSFNRLGVIWAGSDYNLMTNVLRKEWGMKGAAITDCSVFAGYMDIAMGVLAGQDLWDGSGSAGTLNGYENNPAMVHCMHTATKRIIYSISHSIAMNGIASSSKIVAVESWWLTLLKVMTFVGFGIGLVSAGLMVAEFVLIKKE